MKSQQTFDGMGEIDIRSAVLSEGGLYRYELRRTWGNTGKVLWIMLNPSTADEEEDDPTIRKCIGFSKRWGYGGIVVCNLFAYRSTDPRVLKELAIDEAEGPSNWGFIEAAARECDRVVCAWGAHGSLRCRGRHRLKALTRAAYAPVCLGTTKAGEPKHPLYLPYNTQLVAVGP